MLDSDCKNCRKNLSVGSSSVIECRRCFDLFCSQCVGIPKQVPKSFSNPGIFFFCDNCRPEILNFIGTNVTRQIGTILNSGTPLASVDNSVDSSSSGTVDNHNSVNSGTIITSNVNLASAGTSVDLGNQETTLASDSQSLNEQVQNGECNRNFTLDRSDFENVANRNIVASEQTAEEGWTVVNGNRVRKNRHLTNSVGSVHKSGKLDSNKYVSHKSKTKEFQEVYIAGDSIVAHQGRNFKNKLGSDSVSSTCIRGGKIDDVTKAVTESGKCNNIIISVGTNEIGKTGYVGIVNKYKNLFEELHSKKANVVVVGILPRLKESDFWSSKAISVNNFLQQQCTLYNFKFLDLWEKMYSNRYVYSKDGIHLNFTGRAFFSDLILGKLSESKTFFRQPWRH